MAQNADPPPERTGPALVERLFASARDLLAVLDGEDRLVALNPAWRRSLARAYEELVGRSLADLVLETIASQ